MNSTCLNATIEIIRNPIRAKVSLDKHDIVGRASLLESNIKASLSKLTNIKANINMIATPNIKAGVVPLINNINARCGIICSLGKAFLEVEPEYIWLNPEDLSSDEIKKFDKFTKKNA